MQVKPVAGTAFIDPVDAALQPQIDAPFRHHAAQHRHDVPGAAVAKKLAERFLVPRDAMRTDEGDKIPLGIARQSRLGEVRVGADEGLRRAVHVGKIAPTTARNADLFTRRFGMIHDQRAAPEMRCAHHAGGPCTDDCRVKIHRHGVPDDCSRVKRL